MPGSGKSTVGKLLAATFNLPFLDLDHVIEVGEEADIKEIFATKGEPHFRELEQQYLKKTTDQYAQFVLSTGGGTPCFFDNSDFMKARGKVVFLNIEIADLVERFQKQSLETRPLLKEYTSKPALQHYLEGVLAKRKPFYDQADFRISTSAKSPSELSETIISKIRS